MPLSLILLFLQLWVNVDVTLSQSAVSCTPPPADGAVIVRGLPGNDELILSDHLLTFSCEDPGKYLNGSAELKCGQDGEWSAPFPSCKDIPCKLEKIHHNLNVTGLPSANETITYGHKLTFHCDGGYFLDGVKEVECLQTGQWNARFPTCTACLKPPDIPHASVSEESRKRDYQEGDLLYYTCETGYVSGPTITYMCSKDGWVGVRPGKCSLKPCELPDDTPNGFYQITHGDDFVFGTTIKYYCNRGYQMVSKADTRTCLLNKWTNHVPVCEPVSCTPPPADGTVRVRGVPDNDEPILSDRFLTFSCEGPGKYLNGSSKLICGQDGEWSAPFPSCEDITCKAEAMHSHLNVFGLPSANGAMKYGHKLKFQCDNGYLLDGVSEVQCLQTGQWNAHFPTCIASCRDPRAPGRQVTVGNKIQFGCPRGQLLKGSPEIECLPNGQWSAPIPRCIVPVGCGQPPLLQHGYTRYSVKYWYSHGEKVEYVCQRNYFLDGLSQKTCSNGNWIGQMRCLIPVGCGQPPPLENGDVKYSVKNTYSHGERVEYNCQNYHTLEGETHKTCSNGDWIGQMRCLKPCTVTEDEMRQNNIAFKYRYENKLYSQHHDYISFTCTRGRHDGIQAMRQRCIDGVILLPSCQ